MRPRDVKGFNGENRFRSFETLARRPSETRSCAGSTRAHHGSTSRAPLVTNYPRPLDRVTVTGMVSANAFQSFATELARILIGGERERAIDTKRVDRPLIPREKDLDWKEDIDGWNWTDPEAEVFNRTKVEQSSVSWMVEGRWRAREEDRSKWGLSRERQSEAETAIRDK